MENCDFRSRMTGVTHPWSWSRPNSGRLFTMLIGLLWLGTIVLRAATHYVALDGTNDVDNGYITWDGAATEIQWAVDVASDNDTVLVSNGTYNLTNQINIFSNIIVRSFTEQGHGTNDTIVNGNWPTFLNRCVYMTKGTLDSLTISNGCSTNGGGGVMASVGNNRLYNCYICFNSNTVPTYGHGGGGVLVTSGDCVMTNCSIISNRVYSGGWGGGGGIWHESGTLSMTNCAIIGNRAFPWAGGIGTIGGSLTMSNCLITTNSAEWSSGGMWAYSGGSVIRNCVFSNNVLTSLGSGEGHGAGITMMGASTKLFDSMLVSHKSGASVVSLFTASSVMSNCSVTGNAMRDTMSQRGVILVSAGTVINCIIANNSCLNGPAVYAVSATDNWCVIKNCFICCNTNLSGTIGGGGLRSANTNTYPYGIYNCTIVSNRSAVKGGGVYNDTSSNYIANCIIFGNVTTNDDYDEVYNATAAGTNNYWYNCSPTNLVAGQGNITNNPMFVDSANGNYRLSDNSPCINAGLNQNWMTNSYDLDGRTRIRYGTVDMGAYEAIYSGTMYSLW